MFKYRFGGKGPNLLYKSMMIAFIIIALLPVVFGEVMYTKAEKTIEKNIYQYNKILMSSVSGELDKYYSEIEMLSDQLAESDAVKKLMSENITAESAGADSLGLMKEIRRIKSSVEENMGMHNFIKDIYIYVDKTDMIATMNSVMPSRKFFEDSMIKFIDYDYEAWKEKFLTGVQFKQYFPPVNVAYGRMTEKVLLYGQSLPPTSVENIKARIYVLINVQSMLNRIRGMGADGGELMLIDRNQKILMSTTENHKALEQVMGTLSNTRSGIAKSYDGEYVAVYARSSQSEWVVLNLIKKDSFLREMREFGVWIFIVFMIYLMIIIAAVPIIVRRLYTPINNALSKLRAGGSDAPQTEHSEMDYIMSKINGLEKQKNKLDSALYKQIMLFKKEFLRRMLTEDMIFDDNCRRTMNTLNIDLPYSSLCVMIIKTADGGVFGAGGDEVERYLKNTAVANILNEVVEAAGGWRCYETELRDIAAIINIPPGEAWEKKLTGICEVFLNMLREHFQMEAYIGISSEGEGLQCISLCCKEAMTAADILSYEAAGSIMFYGNIQKDNLKIRYSYSLDDESKLINYTGQGDFESVSGLLDKIIETNIRSGMTDGIKRYLYYDLMGTCMKAAKRLNTSAQEKLRQMEGGFEECMPVDDLADRIKEQYKYLCDAARLMKSEQTDKNIRPYEEYILENYNDCNLSVQMIAERFGVSRQSVFGVFKQERGITPGDYISRIRIEKAKRLLEETAMSNMQIAGLTGFSSDTTFVRTFKKYEGVTPKQYREIKETGALDADETVHKENKSL